MTTQWTTTSDPGTLPTFAEIIDRAARECGEALRLLAQAQQALERAW